MGDVIVDAPLTVVMTDLEGSTDLHTRLGDAAARDLIRGHETLVRDALAQHGGHEVKTLGDGFLAHFTSTRRAIECATAIQREVSQTDGLRVRIGMHCGEVIQEAGDIHGAVIAAAARIMAQADGGQILVSDLVRQLAGTAGFRFTERGRVVLKGLEGTWLLHEVEWREAGDEPTARKQSTDGATLIGRQAELSVLRHAVGDAVGGRGRLVLLTGEAGIGKTTLADESAAHARNLGARVIWAACWEGEGAPAFWPWIQVIRAYAAEHDDDELLHDAGGAAAELCRLVPDLASRLPDAPTPPDLEPEQARFRLFDAVASFLGRAAARKPLVVVFDDLHWSDESSIRLLTFIAAQLATNAVAIIGTYRDTDVGAGQPLAALMHDAARRGQVLLVGGLDAKDVGELMATTAGAEPRTELAAAVFRQTAGNPLFVGEMTRLLAAHDALDRTDVAVGLPQGVREVIERRVVRLPQRCVEVLTLAAVVGEEFPLDVVARAAGVGVPALVELLEPALLGGVAREADLGSCRFAHGLFRETLYEGQGAVARAGLHLRVGNALEQRLLEGGDVSPAELAHHFLLASLAGDTSKAVHYARLAGQRATASLAYTEAVALFQRALDVLDASAQPTEVDRAELLLDLAAARWRTGDRPGAQAEVERAVTLARRTGRGDLLARAALGLQRLGGMSGTEDNERIALLEEAERALGGDETPLRVRVLAGLAKERYHAWLHFPAAEDTTDLATEAVAMARRLGDREVLTEALAARHDTLWFTGKEVERLEVAAELERVATDVGDHEQAVEAVLLQAVALLALADRRAVARLERFIAVADDLHTPRFAYLAASRRATVACIRGDIEGAERALAEAAAVADEHGEPDHANVIAAQAFMLGSLQRRRSVAVSLARDAYRFNGSFGGMIEVTECLGLIDDGNIDAARARFEAIDLDSGHTRFLHYGWLAETAALAEAAAVVGNTAALVRLHEELAPYADQCIVVAGAVTFLGSVAHYLGLIDQALGRPDDAKRHFDQALVAYERLGAAGWTERVHAAVRVPEIHAANELSRSGRTWTIAYLDRTARVKDAKGMRDLAVLLGAPGTEVAAADLVARGEATAAGADDVLDDRARREFRARLEVLGADLADAEEAGDGARIARLQGERDALAHELAAALGLGGRSRKLGDPSERARKAVAARIRDAIERVAAEHPDLGQHLRASVRTGTFCVYSPPSPTVWRVTDITSR